MEWSENKKIAETLKHGDSVTCTIDGRKITDAKVNMQYWENYKKLYICQNEQEGYSCDDKLGYKYSWVMYDYISDCVASFKKVESTEPTTKFKVGDKVRVIQTPVAVAKKHIGDVFTISRINLLSSCPYCTDDNDNFYAWADKELELVTEPIKKIKTGTYSKGVKELSEEMDKALKDHGLDSQPWYYRVAGTGLSCQQVTDCIYTKVIKNSRAYYMPPLINKFTKPLTKKTMDSKKTWKTITRKDPEKTFVETGILDENETLTTLGQQLVIEEAYELVKDALLVKAKQVKKAQDKK